MAWSDLSDAGPAVPLLRRSLERGRLGHAYLFHGEVHDLLERAARELACAVNCLNPPETSPAGDPTAACGVCPSCRRIHEGLHPDVHWLRAESKMRLIRVEQVRELIQAVQLKPLEGRFKVGILIAADRLNPQSANAFLKTLEEPPPRSLLVLTSTEPGRMLETILSRCLRLGFPGGDRLDPQELAWLRSFAPGLRQSPGSVMARYRLLDGLLKELAGLREAIESEVEARSPARQFREADAEWKEQWEDEAKAAVEGEYRRRRGQTLLALQWWLRDIWLTSLGQPEDFLAIPELASETRAVAARLPPDRSIANLRLIDQTRALLHTNVQEALALEVAMLRLDL